MAAPSGRCCPGWGGRKAAQDTHLPPSLEIPLLQKLAEGRLDLPSRRELGCDRADCRPSVRGHEEVQKTQVWSNLHIFFPGAGSFQPADEPWGNSGCPTHKYMTKKAKRNTLRKIQQKYLQEIDFSNLPKWEEAPPEMGGGTSRYGRRHLPKWEEALF